MSTELTGAEIVFKALADHQVEYIFGYPGGAVLPLYDQLSKQKKIKHILVRHEQGAGHAAEGYARSTGKPGIVLVTSGPGATNMVTALTDAYMDSIPLVCITGQVPSHLIGTDAFQECDTTGITRPCTKHNWLVKDVNQLAETIHKAFRIATTGRPGPVLIDIPKDIQFKKGIYKSNEKIEIDSYQPNYKGDANKIEKAIELIAQAKKPIFYTGGGVINAGEKASETLRELVSATGFPITSTLQGLGCYPGEDSQFLGMLGMHGTYEANNAMHDCDLMINIGARFDDRITGMVSKFSPGSKKIHIDIDASSINKVVKVDVGIVGDAQSIMSSMVDIIKKKYPGFKNSNKEKISDWWKQIEIWREKNSLSFRDDKSVILPQYAVQRLYELTKHQDTFITTEVGQHQMWAAQYFGFSKPNHWMTSGGLGTMGYGLPSSVGVQIAHPKSLVIDISGEASFLMNMQELSTIVQYNLPVKIFILNNQWMGMVRQWQELNHGSRYSESYTESLPDFVLLAKSFGIKGLLVSEISELDNAIDEMISTKGPVIADIRVEKEENCFPMIPSGAAHNEMILSSSDSNTNVSQDGIALV